MDQDRVARFQRILAEELKAATEKRVQGKTFSYATTAAILRDALVRGTGCVKLQSVVRTCKRLSIPGNVYGIREYLGWQGG